MVFSTEQADQLYEAGNYRGLVTQWERWKEERGPQDLDENILGTLVEAGVIMLRAAWAYYQLGEFEESERLAQMLKSAATADVPAGENARRLLAHCAERQGNLREAERRLMDVPLSRERDNLWVTVLIALHRDGEYIDARAAMLLATEAMMRVPYETTEGHIINNVAWLLHQARDQQDVQKFLSTLPGLIESAIGIYEATGTVQHHLAGALYRASLIFEAANWAEGAAVVIRESIAKWEVLVASQGGEQYSEKLQGAQKQLQNLSH